MLTLEIKTRPQIDNHDLAHCSAAPADLADMPTFQGTIALLGTVPTSFERHTARSSCPPWPLFAPLFARSNNPLRNASGRPSFDQQLPPPPARAQPSRPDMSSSDGRSCPSSTQTVCPSCRKPAPRSKELLCLCVSLIIASSRATCREAKAPQRVHLRFELGRLTGEVHRFLNPPVLPSHLSSAPRHTPGISSSRVASAALSQPPGGPTDLLRTALPNLLPPPLPSPLGTHIDSNLPWSDCRLSSVSTTSVFMFALQGLRMVLFGKPVSPLFIL